MSVQDQHFSILLGKEELKSLLFANKKHIVLLNQQLRIYIAVNEKAQRLAYKHNAYAVVTFDLHGVRTAYFNYNGSRLAKKYAETEIIKQTESARHELDKHFREIESDEWRKKFKVISAVIGTDRAKKLTRPECFMHNWFCDTYTTHPVTTVEDREQLAALGIEVGIFQEISK